MSHVSAELSHFFAVKHFLRQQWLCLMGPQPFDMYCASGDTLKMTRFYTVGMGIAFCTGTVDLATQHT